jgi:hypothetical protein
VSDHTDARYYHPQLRRFLNQDTVLGSIGTSASMNRFAYANGNPISGIDPFGMMQTDPTNLAVLAQQYNDWENSHTILDELLGATNPYAQAYLNAGGQIISPAESQALAGEASAVMVIQLGMAHQSALSPVVEEMEPLMAQPLQQQMAGPNTLTTGLGNISGGATTAENALTQAEQWLGPGYQEIAPGVFRSADGAQQFRMTDSDLTDPYQGAHVHFESIGPDGRTIIENSHVGITNP